MDRRDRWLITSIVFLYIFLFSFEVSADIDINARSAIIIEARSGKVLFEKNADKKFPPASTAKIMTAIIAIENLSLEKEITVSGEASGVEPTLAPLKPNVRYILKDIICALLIKSANDAAFVIAEEACGNEEKFAEFMNTRGRGIGMQDTYFANASGLPTGVKDSQYTTSRDLAKMMRYSLRHDMILDIMSRANVIISGSDNEKILLETHNLTLLDKKSEAWGKTGYTKEAKRTFVGIDPRKNPRIVFALLQSNDLWNDIAKLKKHGLLLYRKNQIPLLFDIIDWVIGN